MNLKSLSALGAGLLLAACSQAPRTDSLTQYVDMRIGTGGHGHVFMLSLIHISEPTRPY